MLLNIKSSITDGRTNMKKAPQTIKLDMSKLLGYNAQGTVMAGAKPVGQKPSITQGDKKS